MESPHASNCVILKANINQFCIADCPGAVCNTCGVFGRMDVRRRFPTQTSDDNCGEATSLRGLCISKLYHIRSTHALPCPTLRPFFNEKTVFALMLIPPKYTHIERFSLVCFCWQSGLSLLTLEERILLACFGKLIKKYSTGFNVVNMI